LLNHDVAKSPLEVSVITGRRVTGLKLNGVANPDVDIDLPSRNISFRGISKVFSTVQYKFSFFQARLELK
jgi:hypothetical protein